MLGSQLLNLRVLDTHQTNVMKAESPVLTLILAPPEFYSYKRTYYGFGDFLADFGGLYAGLCSLIVGTVALYNLMKTGSLRTENDNIQELTARVFELQKELDTLKELRPSINE